MESIAALGLASNIIQIVDFSSRVISRIEEVYHSPDGQTVEYAALSIAAKRLDELSTSLLISGQSKGYAILSTANKQLIQLKKECTKVVEEVEDELKQAKLKASSGNRKWQSIRQGLKSVRNDKHMSALNLRLSAIREQIDTAVLISIRASIAEQPKSHADRSQTTIPTAEPKQRKTRELLNMIVQMDWQPSSPGDVSAFSAHMSSLASHDWEARLQAIFHASVLAHLRFQIMPDREDNIPEAHQQTFQWLFGDKPQAQTQQMQANVRDWLQEDKSSIYWVTGKPGSGKSTLMKYLFHHDSLPGLLKKWAGPNKLITAGFYFWNSGSTIQMSLVGLLRAFLYTCFTKDSSLLLPAMSERWKRFLAAGGEDDYLDDHQNFTEKELLRMFDRVISDTSRRFFFLIDGLDEFEGEPNRLIQFVTGVARSHVKLCVASRPWLEFEDAFKQRPSLLLQDLTGEDIDSYVTSHFEHNEHFATLQVSSPQAASALLQSIVIKASGVFLWVHLVVQSLLIGFQKSDSFFHLQARLDALPGDLEALFDNLLGSLEAEYFQQACETFRLLHVFRQFSNLGGPTLLALYYADDHDTRSIFPSGAETFENSAMKQDAMRRRLNARCKGLIEVSKADKGDNRVRFLHRTARDYIESDVYWPKILQNTGHDSFEADRYWANALLRIQRSPFQTKLLSNTVDFVRCVHMIQCRTGIVQKKYLDGFYYMREQRRGQFDLFKDYSTELLDFWGSYDKIPQLDAYMSVLLDGLESSDRKNFLGKHYCSSLSQEKGLFWETQTYYRIPRASRWMRHRPSLPDVE